VSAITFVLKRSAEAGKQPQTTQLTLGELALNVYDGKIYLKKDIAGVETIVSFSDDTTFGKLTESNYWSGESNIFGYGSGATRPPLSVYTTPNSSAPHGLAVWLGTQINGQNIHLHNLDGSRNVIESNSSIPKPFYILNNANESLVLGTNGIEALRVTETGKVLIGTQTDSSPAKLQVEGNVKITGETQVGLTAALYSSSSTSLSTNPTVIDTFRSDTFRSVKYQVQISDNVNFETAEILLIHDGVTPHLTTFGNVFTSQESLGHFDAVIVSTSCSLIFMASVASNKTIKFFRSSLTL